MKLSIIICTYNREKFILKSLYSIAHQNADVNIFELIIINNNSTDKTHELILDFIEKNQNISIKYFIEIEQGLSHARNRGIKESTGDICAFLDDDAIACEEYVINIIYFFNKYTQVSAMGGKILPQFEVSKPKWASKYLMPVFSVLDLGNKIVPFKTENYPIGANMAFRKSVFTQYGYFNTNLGRRGSNMEGGEEKDLFNRICLKNEIIYYNPIPWVYHIIPENRTQLSFLKKQAIGIGFSERIRVVNKQKTYNKRIFQELIKWIASLILFFIYSFSLQWKKAKTIVLFRWWVSKGFFTGKLY